MEGGASWEDRTFTSHGYGPSSSGSPCPEGLSVGQPQQVDARVDVTIMMRATGTCPFTDIHRLPLTFLTTRRTDLRRCEPLIRLDERPSVEV